MIKNGKYFLAAQKNNDDFKELFKRLASAGAGRPVDKEGFPQGPWTADLLAEAITRIDANGSGIDLRTVQLWFQSNEKGIGTDNIRWLARVFGCDDPEATSDWQRELSASQSRLTAKRQEKNKFRHNDLRTSSEVTSPRTAESSATRAKKQFNLVRTSEALFSRRSLLDLPILVFACIVTLGFLTYLLGVHDVTYSPIVGLDKQVGFLWSPGWTFEGLVLLPLYLIVVTQTLKFWKVERTSALRMRRAKTLDANGWEHKVDSFSIAFWVIFLVCLLIVCTLQWVTAYLSPLMQGARENALVDWMLVATVRPDVISIPEALALSILAFLYSGMIYWFYLVGLLLLFIVASDFCDVYQAVACRSDESQRLKAIEVGSEILWAIYRCTVFGILIAVCIRLNTAYLLSDGANIVGWLLNDALSAFGAGEVLAGWADVSALPSFTSLLLVMITCFVFLASLKQIYWVLDLPSTSVAIKVSDEDQQAHTQLRQTMVPWIMMVSVVALLVVSFLLIGQFLGFSILLAGSVLVATYCLFR
ncbi:MAG: hypothetical protein WA782_15755 [Sulfitobacter sp.]